jgi:hypothetical protein
MLRSSVRILHFWLLVLLLLSCWIGCSGSPELGLNVGSDGGGAVDVGTGDSSVPAAPTIPDAPLAVTAVGGDGAATVSWSTPFDGGSAITGYAVTSTPGGITVLVDVAAGKTTAVVAGLTNAKAYTFIVVATNKLGTSKPSAPSNAVTPIGAPLAPTDVVAKRGNAQSLVSWKAPASDGGSAITEYVVTSSPGALTATATAAASSIAVAGLTNGTSYTFTVVAKNAKGTSPPSTASNAVVPVVPTLPGAPTAPFAVRGNAAASVSWTAPAQDGGSDILGYTVTSNPGGATATVSGDVTMAVVAGLTNGTSYTFTVVATNVVGSSVPSTDSNAVTPAMVPGIPKSVVAVGGRGEATITWAPPDTDGGSPITKYTITRLPGGTSVDADGTATGILFAGLTNGTSYTFTVKATNALGTGLASTASNAVTPAIEPDAPSTVKATIGNAAAQISWTAPANNGSAITGYTVTSSPGGVSVDVDATSTTAIVPGLANDTPYTFTVVAKNAVGSSAPSAASNSVTPTSCTLAGYTALTSTVSTSGCAVRDRDVSGCQALRTSIGLSGFWLRFSCRVTITKTTYNGANVIQLAADGQPDYPSFYFPSADACYETYASGKNMGEILSRTFRFTVPATPTPVMGGVMTPGGSIGMGVNGVSLFDNRAKQGDDIYQEALTFDRCGAHPNVVGYHYHVEPLAISNDDGNFIGVMRDGYPVYGRREPNGTTPVLDNQGGHTGFTIDSPAAAVYHYHVNQQTSTNPNTVGEKQWFISKGRFNGSFNTDCTGC